MLSDKKNLEIANVCYANVSGLFSRFIDIQNRGPNFSWNWFISYCKEASVDWMLIHNVYHFKKDKQAIDQKAQQVAHEIAINLVKNANLL